MKNTNVKKLVLTAFFIAMCVFLPMLFHMVPKGGPIFLPMHIPVFVCGLLLGWPWGLICGFIGPLLSSILTGMPASIMVPSMMLELSIYGFISGLVYRKVNYGKYKDIYIALISAMVLGRVGYGFLNALVLQPETYSFSIWISAAFFTAIPGIIIQLVLVPFLVTRIQKTNLFKGKDLV